MSKPKKPPAPKQKPVWVFLSESDHADLRRAAALAGERSMASFARSIISEAARKVLKDNNL